MLEGGRAGAEWVVEGAMAPGKAAPSVGVVGGVRGLTGEKLRGERFPVGEAPGLLDPQVAG